MPLILIFQKNSRLEFIHKILKQQMDLVKRILLEFEQLVDRSHKIQSKKGDNR